MDKCPLKILIVGYGRSGKDEAAMFMSQHLGFKYGGSTSWAALPIMAKFLGLHPMHAWETRHQNRELWKSHLDYLRRDDACLLMRLALADGANIITGVRGGPEIDLAITERLFDHIIWINRPCTPVDPTVDFGPDKASLVINNGCTLEYFHFLLTKWAQTVAPINNTKYTNELLSKYTNA
jgi:hypothetical protein